MAVQKRVIRLLMPYGAAAESVGITQMIPSGQVLLLGERADFEDLCRVLKLSREQCKRVREEYRKRKNAEGGRAAKLWAWRLADIRAWIRMIWPDGVPPKYLPRMLWITTNALAWSVADVGVLPREIHSLACEIAPGLSAQVGDQMTSYVQARLAKDSKERGQLYKFSDEALADALTAGLTDAERSTWEKVAAESLSGRQRRRQLRSSRAKVARTADKRRMAWELKSKKLSIRKIAKVLGVSKSTTERWLKEGVPFTM